MREVFNSAVELVSFQVIRSNEPQVGISSEELHGVIWYTGNFYTLLLDHGNL